MASSTDDANVGFVLDDKGDLYVYCVARMGSTPSTGTAFSASWRDKPVDTGYVFA